MFGLTHSRIQLWLLKTISEQMSAKSKNSSEYLFVQLSKTRNTTLFSSSQSPAPFVSASYVRNTWHSFNELYEIYTPHSLITVSRGQPFLLTDSNQYWAMPLRIKTGAGVLKWLHVDKHCAATGVLQSSVKRAKNVNELESKYATDAFHTLKGKTIFFIHESMYFTES